MKAGIALAALAFGGMSFAQSATVVDDGSGETTTLLSNIDPSDIAAIPEPEVLGPPIGIAESVATISYNAAEETASVLALVTAATDAQTGLIAVATDAPAASETGVSKRSYVGGSTGNVQRRDVSYPIDTSKYGIPSGYTPAFINYQGATQARGYLTYKTLSTYDPKACTAACDKISSCQFANIYYEKDPDSKNNPVDVIKCSLYSIPQTNCTATNKGQWRGSFEVKITGSNGYNKAAAPAAPAGYSLDTLPAAINAPVYDSQGQWRFIQPVYLDTYNPALCAAACDKQTAWDKSQASDDCNYKTCVYANMYILSQNGVPKTVVCALYTEATDSSYADNTGYSTDTDFYQVSNSIALTNTTAVKAGYPQYCAPLQKDIDYLSSAGAEFCTSYLGYVPPTTKVTTTVTPATSTVHATLTIQTTLTSVYSTEIVQTTAAAQNYRRQDDSNMVTTTVELPFITVVDNETMIETQTSVLVVSADSAATSGAVLTPAAVEAAATAAGVAKRGAVATPTSIVGWPAQKISAACSQIATGTVTATVTAAGDAPLTTVTDATQIGTQVTSVVSTVVTTVVSSSVPTNTPTCPKTGTSGQLSLGGYSLGFPTPIDENHDPLFWTSLGSFGDEFIWTGTSAGGFLYHVDSALCLALGPAAKKKSPLYIGSPFTLAPCVCGTSTSQTQSFFFKAIKNGKKGTKNCLAIQGDYDKNKGPYFPKLKSQGKDNPFSGVYGGDSPDTCITFETDN